MGILRFFAVAGLLIAAACGGGGGGGGGPQTPACTSTCATSGATRCSGSGVQTCAPAASGCLDWSAPVACGNGASCDSATNQCVALPVNPCGAVPSTGVCESTTSVKACVTATGAGEPQVVTYACATGETCQLQSGRAACVLTAACRDGETQCSGSSLRTCTGGTWSSQACANGCATNVLESTCLPATALKTFTGTVTFEAKKLNVQGTDWAAPGVYYASFFLVLSVGGDGTVYDAAYTAVDGKLSIRVPQQPSATDNLFVVAAADNGQGGLAFAVADPGYTIAGERVVGNQPPNPRLWSWSWRADGLVEGQELRVRVSAGSAAANVYLNLLRAYLRTYQAFGVVGPPLVTWVTPGTSWDCGACFALWPESIGDFRFASQIWIAGDSNEGYWSDAVTQHELGHWTMSTYGTSPGEGGTHFTGNPTFPGQAWSEGWATWFSSDVRGSPLYYDKQGGEIFWLDLSQHAGNMAHQRPSPTAPGGVLQKLDENHVSAMLWSISRSSSTASQSMFDALASPAMNTAPFGRGYTRHTWQLSGLSFVNVVDTHEPKPTLPDFLDALVCAGMPAATIDAATQPSTYYPYPSATPLCR